MLDENNPLMVPGSAFVYELICIFSENCFLLYTFMAIVLYTDFADDEDTTHSQYIHNECICATSYFSTDSIWRFFVRVGLERFYAERCPC